MAAQDRPGTPSSQPMSVTKLYHHLRTDKPSCIAACYYYGLDTAQTIEALGTLIPPPNTGELWRTIEFGYINGEREKYSQEPPPNDEVSLKWRELGNGDVRAANTTFKNWVDEAFHLAINRVWCKYYGEGSSSSSGVAE